MTHNNPSDNKKKADPSTYTAYGDPVKSSKPTINTQFKDANSTIAQSTQEANRRKK